MKYKCVYISGSGEEYDGGLWEKKETAKIITFICVEKSFYEVDWDKLICRKDNKCPHHFTDWEDGSYTVYPNRCGTPHIFTPVAS
jgi:hypothetical protein